MAFLPQFMDRGLGRVPSRFAILGAIFVAFEVLAAGAGWPRRRQRAVAGQVHDFPARVEELPERHGAVRLDRTYVTYVTFVGIYELTTRGTTSREPGITATPRISIIASGCHSAVVPMPAMAG